jgi:predicted MFS family arabinose efflux permease
VDIMQTPDNGRPLLAVLALSVGTFSLVTTEMLPIGLLPLIATDLHRSLPRTGLLVAVYALVVLVMSVPLTLVTGRIPRRILLGGDFAVFTASALASALAPGFGFLLASRVVTAVAQALFWSIVVSTAVGRFPAEKSARVVGALFTGTALAPVVGLPLGTWIGQQAGWRAAFLVMAVIGGGTGLVVVAALPTIRPEDEPAHTGTAPNARRYVVLLIVTALAITGMFTAYTYVTAHLVDVAGLPPGGLSAALLACGAAGVLGAFTSAVVGPRWPRLTLTLPLAVMAGALGLVYLAGAHAPTAVLGFGLLSFSGSGFAADLANRLLLIAPSNTDLANSGSSSAYNLGIGGGAWIGGVIVAGPGVHATALVGTLLAATALVLMLSEPRTAPADSTIRTQVRKATRDVKQ